MFNIYIILQFILFVIFVVSRICISNILFMNIINLLPIVLNFLIVILYNKSDYRLKLALFLTIIADIILMFISNYTLGISVFIAVQTCYQLHLRNLDKKWPYIILAINFTLSLIFGDKLIVLEASIYACLSIYNIYYSSKLTKKDKKYKYIRNGIFLLAICDISILIVYLFNLTGIYKLIFDFIEHFAYIPSQILIVIYVLKRNL